MRKVFVVRNGQRLHINAKDIEVGQDYWINGTQDYGMEIYVVGYGLWWWCGMGCGSGGVWVVVVVGYGLW